MPLSCTVSPGSTPGTFKVTVDGTTPAMLWIKWYSTTAAVMIDPTLIATPYEDTVGGTLLVNAMQGPTFPYTSADVAYPVGTRWVMALAWTLDATNPTLNLSTDKREFTPPPTTTSTSSSTSSTSTSSSTSSTSTSSTTESSTTSSSTTSSTTTFSSTTPGSPGMATWTWQNVGGVNQWVLTTPCSSGSAIQPGFNGMMPGDTAQTTCS